ncbi:SAF domain-containing protein [Kineococcus glutinatus]|uniref:SAF domain-containing protein n=1 Tax=Kineococcus glutinatus TaxID=1070872 RepID=A0ABP9HIE0_9ACTN
MGVALVLVSVLLGARVVSAADRTAPVWAVTSTLAAGQPIRSSDLRVERVRLPAAAAAAYLPATSAPDGDWVALRTLGAGELVPRSAVGGARRLAARPLSLSLPSVPAGVVVGTQVDVWVTPAAEAGGPTGSSDAVDASTADPEQILQGVEVSAVSSGGSALAAQRTCEVQVVVPEERVADVIGALASGAAVTVVPVPGSAGAHPGGAS